MGSALVDRMVELLHLDSEPEPMPGATKAVWAVGDQVLRVGPSARMEKELAAARAASAVVRTPGVLAQVEVEGQTGVLTERIRGGPVGDIEACTEDEAQFRGHLCGSLQLRLATVTHPAGVPPVPGTDADGSEPALLHLDFHPFNVLLDPAASPVVIDWANAASGPAALDQARTAALLTFDPAARRRTGDPRWNALIRGWSDECGWHQLSTAAWTWALEFLLRDLAPRCTSAELEPARAALDALRGQRGP